MKGLSVLIAIGLLLLAYGLAARLKRAGALPAQQSPRPPAENLKHPNLTNAASASTVFTL